MLLPLGQNTVNVPAHLGRLQESDSHADGRSDPWDCHEAVFRVLSSSRIMRAAKPSSLLLSILIGVTFAGPAQPASAQTVADQRPKDAEVVVDLDQSTHTMAEGIGASWHALGPTAFWYNGLHGRINRWARGSCFGGNPPLNYTNAWQDLLGHARWLGLDFIRVEAICACTNLSGDRSPGAPMRCGLCAAYSITASRTGSTFSSRKCGRTWTGTPLMG